MNHHRRDIARERFRALLEREDSDEVEWQRLFSGSPYILTESLPLRLHEDDLQPLARPGRAEPDFIFFPRTRDSLAPHGVIEIKRPDTRLLRIPRRDVLCLSADAATALAQAQKYAMAFPGSTTLVRPDGLVILGNRLHIFIIAGMSQEIAAKVTSDILRAQLRQLLPAGVTLIPYDTLLRAFESKFPPRVHVLNSALPNAVATLEVLLRVVETSYRNYQGYWLSDDVIDAWYQLESEFLRISGAVSAERFIDRTAFEIVESLPDDMGRRPLATEAPNPSMFAARVCGFIVQVLTSAAEVGLPSSLPRDPKSLWEGSGAYASD